MEQFRKKRNRSRPADPFEVRLQRFAEDARTAANRLPPGGERDALIKKAEQTENALDLCGSLALHGRQTSSGEQ
jgi:hypothetical protein